MKRRHLDCLENSIHNLINILNYWEKFMIKKLLLKFQKLYLHNKTFKSVGPIQYIVHLLYALAEPLLIKICDLILRSKLKKPLIKILPNLYNPKGIVVSTNAICRFIDHIYDNEKSINAKMAIGECVCQKSLNRYSSPSYKDIALLYAADIYNKRLMTHKIIHSKDEIKTKIRDFERLGLVHSVFYCFNSGKWAFVICNCDNEICVPVRLFLNGKKTMAAGPEIISFDPSNCNSQNCGNCVKRCKFNANSFNNETLIFNNKNCLGCGLCISQCKGNSRKLVKRSNYSHSDKITTEILLGKHI